MRKQGSKKKVLAKRDAPNPLSMARQSVNLLSVVTYPNRDASRFGALFESDREGAVFKESAAAKRITTADFAAYTSPAMKQLFDRFLANIASRDERAEDAVSEENVDVSTVPSKFFEEDFVLASASAGFESGGETVDDEEQALGVHLDVIEGALVVQLNKSSNDFFQALSNFQELSDQVSATVSQVRTLRSRIQSMQCDAVQGVLRVPRLACRQTNAIALHAKLVAMREVKKTCDGVHAAMLAEEYASTVGRIGAAKRTLRAHASDVKSLRHVAKRLDQFYELAISYMGSRWVNLAVASTWGVGDDGPVKDGVPLPSFASLAKQPLSLSTDAVAPVVEGLVRSNRMRQFIAKFQQRFDEEASEIVKTVVNEYDANDGAVVNETDDPTATPNGEPSAERLAALPAAAFQGCFETCLDHLLAASLAAVALHNFLRDYLRAAASVAPDDDELVEDDDDTVFAVARAQAPAHIRSRGQRIEVDADLPSAADAAADLDRRRDDGSPPPLTKTTLLEVVSLSAESTRAVCEAGVRKLAKLIALREEATAKAAKLSDVKNLWDAGRAFATAVEAAANDNEVGNPLRRSLLAQVRAMIDRQHATHKNELMTTLDSEKWQQLDVTPDRQKGLDRLATGYVSKKDEANGKAAETASPETPAPSKKQSAAKAKRELRGATVDGKSFKVVWSAVLLLDMVAAKLTVVPSLPAVAPDVVQRILDLLRFFESRARQLVLFAGAIHSSAHLKTITARHLGLASQCLSLVVALAPHIRAAVADHLTNESSSKSPLLDDLDEVTNTYLDHHNRILSKFVSIIAESLDISAKSLVKTNWDSRTDAKCDFVSDVDKNVSSLHGVLAKLLPPDQLQEVFTNIFDHLATKIPSLFQNINPEMPQGRKKCRDDLTFLANNVAKLAKPQSTSLAKLQTFINDKYPAKSK